LETHKNKNKLFFH